MKAVVIESFGGAETLKLKDVPTPSPQEHEVLIQIEYTSVNPVDWKIREGILKSRLPHQFPLIPGWDASGTITSVGINVRNFKVGDQVYAYCRKPIIHDGTYAEFICFDAAHVALKPKNISFAQAAAIPLAGLTAWQALFDYAKLQPGQSILVHAGAGGVGSFAIQFANLTKADVWTTCSSSNNEYVKKLGAAHIIDYTQENFVTAIKREKKDGFDLVLDNVGGKTLTESLTLVKKGGTLVSIVEMLGPEIAIAHKIRTGFIFVRPDGRELKEIASLIEQGKVKPSEITEMSLDEAGKAQEKNRLGHTRGKIVLKIK